VNYEIFCQRNLDLYPLFSKRIFKRPLFVISAYVLLWVVLFIGFEKVLFFIPESWGTANEDDIGVRMMISIALSFSVMYIIVKKLILDKENIRDGLMVLASCDKTIFSKLKNCYIDTYNKNRDIPLALLLEKKRKLKKFGYYLSSNSPFKIDRVLENWAGQLNQDKPHLKELKESIYGGYDDFLYKGLKETDKIIKEEIPKALQIKYPEQIYYFRVNFLDKFIVCLLKEQKLIWDKDKTPKGEEIIYELCHLITKKIYGERKEYEKLKRNFNMRELELYLEKSQADIKKKKPLC
jgi:hypothetical protein